MRKAIPGAVAVALIAAAVAAGPAAARQQHATTVTKFSVVEHVVSAHRIGNREVTKGVLTEVGVPGHVLGTDKVSFTQTGHVRGVVFFPDGKLKVNGDLRHNKVPIVGGTRRWNGASGKLKFRSLSRDRTLLTFTVATG
jgi:hypothetical protein